jgi:hypothetical protein
MQDILNDEYDRQVLDFTAYKNRLNKAADQRVRNDVKFDPSMIPSSD